MVPLRCWDEVFNAMEKVTVPEPVPELPDVIVIHSELDCAVRGQLAADVVTVMFPVCAR
jgi:hypothetical protein